MSDGRLSITVLGSGTSVGVPTIGCHCAVCTSEDPHDRRLRPSVLVRWNDHAVLIDTTPDFRQQALAAKIERVDAILFTHGHADHIMGLDDVRPLNYRMTGPLRVYGSAETIATVRRTFQYIFDTGPTESSRPRIETCVFDGEEPLRVGNLDFVPIRLSHGQGTVYGFRFGSAAYLTDHSDIPSESLDKLRDLDVLFLDALRHRPHPTHSTVEHSLHTVEELKPRRAYFTHICHDLPHAATEAALPRNVHLAYDGLVIDAGHGAPSGFRVFRSLEDVPVDFGPCALTIGNFDGVHAAHRNIMRRAAEIARERGWRAAAMTFHPHPASVVAPDKTPQLLTQMERRCDLMREAGLDEVLIMPFTAALAKLSPEQFIEQIVVRRLGARAVLVGHNFRFGRGASGNTATLHELGQLYGFEVEICPAVRRHGSIVGSTAVRKLISSGDMIAAWRMLERPFALEGSVVGGHGVGSRQTVPTLNLSEQTGIVPCDGVYVTRAFDLDDGRQWRSVSNIGFRPTFDGDRRTIETFLLSKFDGRAPARIRVEFLYRLRDERKFDTPEALKTQILHDVARAERFHRRVAEML
ncbi:MAG TPA: bifunctional riboflavin kinase/FAD synthetase [Bryobacteraceae bacterium]|nr:bifunctional riboflavin kinase/FAD synthetase [Bryobacteraceae bacterium]